MVFDRYNNTEREIVVCYNKIDDYENIYGSETEVSGLTSDLINW